MADPEGLHAPHIRIAPDPQDARILCVTLERPVQRNAMSARMVAELLALLESRVAVEAGAIVLCGEGRGFCAGSDLGELATMDAHDRSRFEADCGRIARAMMAFPRPLVAGVHGFAIGGGLTLAAACDIVISAPDVRWSLPEVPIGLFPAWGLDGVTRRVGQPRARRLAWGIDMLDGASAMCWGLADEIADDPVGVALERARQLSALPHAQVGQVKRYFSVERTGEEADALANALFLSACDSDTAKANFEARRAKAKGEK